MFFLNEKRIKEYSGYCMDEVRAQLWEYIGNVYYNDASSSEWVYLYNWGVSYEWVDYSFSCKVYNKENVDLKLDELNKNTCEWESCDVPGTPEEWSELEEAQTYTIVWPDEWFTEQVEAWQLVLRKVYEDYADVIFIDKSIWQDYINSDEITYWDNITFKWELTAVDWAAGTHYYAANSIEKLDKWLNISDNEEGSALIIVFSPTGNTKRIATFISEINGSELTELIPVQEYTDEDRNWRNEESRTFKEFKDPSIRPEIQTEFNLDGYDTIYLWFPIWFGITPNIILTLLENYDFAGKNVVLFCTSEHVGIEKAVEYLQPYNLNVIGSRRFAQDATKEEVQEWLESL